MITERMMSTKNPPAKKEDKEEKKEPKREEKEKPKEEPKKKEKEVETHKENLGNGITKTSFGSKDETSSTLPKDTTSSEEPDLYEQYKKDMLGEAEEELED